MRAAAIDHRPSRFGERSRAWASRSGLVAAVMPRVCCVCPSPWGKRLNQCGPRAANDLGRPRLRDGGRGARPGSRDLRSPDVEVGVAAGRTSLDQSEKGARGSR
jgi:hypothetical protein